MKSYLGNFYRHWRFFPGHTVYSPKSALTHQEQNTFPLSLSLSLSQFFIHVDFFNLKKWAIPFSRNLTEADGGEKGASPSLSIRLGGSKVKVFLRTMAFERGPLPHSNVENILTIAVVEKMKKN